MGMGMGQYDKMFTKIGNRAGAAVGAGTGLAQIIKGRKDQKRADAVMPSDVDSNQSAFLAELQQKKNAINTGAEFTSSMDAINNNLAQTQDVLSENTGGDVGGTISALLKANQVANKGIGEVGATGQQQENFYTGMYGNLLDKITQRKLELGLLRHAQAQSDATTEKRAGWANFLGGAQSFMNWKGGNKSAQNPINGSQTSAPTTSGGGGTPIGNNSGGGGTPVGDASGSAGSSVGGSGGGGTPVGDASGGAGSSVGGSGGGGGASSLLSMFGK